MTRPAALEGVPMKDAIPTGSRVVCNPPVLNTDEDWVVLPTTETAAALEARGFNNTSGEYSGDGDGQTNYRLDTLNLIVVSTEELFERWRWATAAAKKLNLVKKADRIALFAAVVDRREIDVFDDLLT